MRGLLDINVIIALLDEDHVFHAAAHEWYGKHRALGWASCPLTENGTVRIMTNPNYKPAGPRTAGEVIAALQTFVENSDHLFWPDDLSLRDATRFDPTRIQGSRQVTELYLLALAARNESRLITFDEGIAVSSIEGANLANLCVVTNTEAKGKQ